MLDAIRNRLSPKDVKYFKLAVWAALITWVVSFISISVIVAMALDVLGQKFFDGTLGDVIGFFWAVSYIMTAFYAIYLMVRWANRKLRG